jgi:hypothetical protein
MSNAPFSISSSDLDFSGTLAAWARRSKEVSLICCCSRSSS